MQVKIRIPLIALLILFLSGTVSGQGLKPSKDEHCMLILGLDNYRTLAVEVRGGKLRSFEQFPFLASPQKEGWLYFYSTERKMINLATNRPHHGGVTSSCDDIEEIGITIDKVKAMVAGRSSVDSSFQEKCKDIWVVKNKPFYLGGGIIVLNWMDNLGWRRHTHVFQLATALEDTSTLDFYFGPLNKNEIEIGLTSTFKVKDLIHYKKELYQKGLLGQVENCPHGIDDEGYEGECALMLDTTRLELEVIHNEGIWKWRLRAKARYNSKGSASLITTPLSPQYAPYNSFKADYKKLEEKMFRRDLLVKNMFLSPGGEHLFVYTGDALYGFTYPSLRMIFEQPLNLPAGTNIVSSEWSYGHTMAKWWEALLPDK